MVEWGAILCIRVILFITRNDKQETRNMEHETGTNDIGKETGNTNGRKYQKNMIQQRKKQEHETNNIQHVQEIQIQEIQVRISRSFHLSYTNLSWDYG